MANPSQVTAIRPGLWHLPDERTPHQPERHRDPAAAARFAAAVAEAGAAAEGPGRDWTETPGPDVAALAAPAPRMARQQVRAYQDVLAFTAPLPRNRF